MRIVGVYKTRRLKRLGKPRDFVMRLECWFPVHVWAFIDQLRNEWNVSAIAVILRCIEHFKICSGRGRGRYRPSNAVLEDIANPDAAILEIPTVKTLKAKDFKLRVEAWKSIRPGDTHEQIKNKIRKFVDAERRISRRPTGQRVNGQAPGGPGAESGPGDGPKAVPDAYDLFEGPDRKNGPQTVERGGKPPEAEAIFERLKQEVGLEQGPVQ